jgi:putative DNA primase/helicase
MDMRMDPDTARYSLEKHLEDEASLFKGDDGLIYARFQSVDGVEIVPVDSKQVEEWLTRHCIQYGIPVYKPAIKLAIASCRSKHWTKTDRLCVRVGSYNPDKEVYWDLADKTGRAVHVTAAGWNIVERPNVLFPTYQCQEALTEPDRGGSIHGLADMFGLSAHDQALIVSFCLTYLRGSGPYPILLITGPEASGRTTLVRYLRALLDPSTLALRNLPKKEGELAVSARQNHLLVYDDVQVVPPLIGAAICKLSKGTVFSERRGGREQILFQGARPIILAGSDEMLLNRELSSRALVVRLQSRTHFTSNVGGDFKGLAQVRGALLDIVSHGLSRWHDVTIPAPIRDFEFEKWMAACDLSRWGLGQYQDAYEANVSDGLADLVELDPLLTTLRDYMAKVKTFRGTAGQLLQELNATANIAKGSRWPENPQTLSLRLRRDAKLLPEVGMEFGIKEGRNRDRMIVAHAKLPPEPLQVEDAMPRRAPERAAGSQRKATIKKPAMPDFFLGG